MSNPNYRDVLVTVNGRQHRIAENYAYLLICTKTGGWELWWKWDGKERLIGGEYHSKKFRIEVKRLVMCNSDSEDGDDGGDRPSSGWNGMVMNRGAGPYGADE